ncbi:MAG: carboxypeptidase-like regulatory domain-containing protein [Actinomycetota bacterium]
MNTIVDIYRADDMSTPLESTHTAADGSFDVGLEAGTYLVDFEGCLSYPSYGTCPFSHQWYSSGSSSTPQPVTVSNAASKAAVNVTLADRDHISGHVYGIEHKPVQGVIVAAEPQDGGSADEAYSHADGSYDLYVDPGTYKLYVAPTHGDGLVDYDNQWYDGKVSQESAEVLTVLRGHSVADVDVTLAASGHITGHVADTAGNPVSDAEVELISKDDGSPGGWTYTDAAGNYKLAAGPGTYLVHFTGFIRTWAPTPSYTQRYRSQWFDHMGGGSAATPVVVAAGNDMPGIDAALEALDTAPQHIVGRVTDSEGKPIAGMSVYAFSDGASPGSAPTSAVTDVVGRYSMPVTPGTYAIDFSGDIGAPLNRFGGNHRYVEEWYQASADSVHAKHVLVSAATDVTNINASLVPLRRISGHVADSAGHPIAYTVVAASDQLGQTEISETDINGNFSLYVTPGAYKVEFVGEVRNPAFDDVFEKPYATQWFKNRSASGVADVVMVTSTSDVSNVDAVLGPVRYIKGRVTDASGHPIAYAFFFVHDVVDGQSAGSEMTRTEVDGTFALALDPGTYSIEFNGYVTVPQGSIYVQHFEPQWYSGKSSFATANRLVLTDAADLTGVDLTLAELSNGSTTTTMLPPPSTTQPPPPVTTIVAPTTTSTTVQPSTTETTSTIATSSTAATTTVSSTTSTTVRAPTSTTAASSTTMTTVRPATSTSSPTATSVASGGPTPTAAPGAGTGNIHFLFHTGDNISDGLTATCSATGLAPFSDATCTARSTPAVLWSGKANAAGTIDATVMLPRSLGAGTHTLTLSGVASNGSTLTVVGSMVLAASGQVTGVADSSASGGPTTTLASPTLLPGTGVEASLIVRIGMYFFLAGALMMLISFVRRGATPGA